MKITNVLVACSDTHARQTLTQTLSSQFTVYTASTLDQIYTLLNRHVFQIGFIDISLLKSDQHDIPTTLSKLWDIDPNLEVITLTYATDQATLEAVQTIHEGAFRYLTLPLVESEILLLLEHFSEAQIMRTEISYLRQQTSEPALLYFQTSSPTMKAIYSQIKRASQTPSNIYITGDTGTGKSYLAKLIHQNSPRAKHPFISIHCGAIPESLIESELFGHEKGAFTGADQLKLGKFELAKHGTLFLDEINTMPISAQIKLLHIIQDKKAVRIGGSKEIDIDVRIITASNEDLSVLCDKGLFRKDLFYRLNVFPILLPLLRDRKEDIPLLVEILILKLNKQFNRTITGIHPKAMSLFMQYSWPGNIRELENVLERAFILEHSSIIMPYSLPRELEITETIDQKENSLHQMTLKDVRTIEVARIEQTYLKNILQENKGRIGQTAKIAGITTRQLHKLMTKYGIKKESYKV